MKTLHAITAALGLSTLSAAAVAAQPTPRGLVAGLDQAAAAAPSPNTGAAAVPDATPEQPVIRSSSRQLAQTPVPANGTTLTLGYDARI